MKKSYLLLLSAFLLVGCGTSISSEQKDIYDVIVCYPDGTPVNGGVSVEWCTDSTCSKSVVVDENGKASADLDEDTYTVHVGIFQMDMRMIQINMLLIKIIKM